MIERIAEAVGQSKELAYVAFADFKLPQDVAKVPDCEGVYYRKPLGAPIDLQLYRSPDGENVSCYLPISIYMLDTARLRQLAYPKRFALSSGDPLAKWLLAYIEEYEPREE